VTRRNVYLTLAAVGLICLAVAGAWGFERLAMRNADVYRIPIVRDGVVLAEYDIAQLTALGTERIEMQGKFEEGPPLLVVLEAAGVGDFDSVVVTGIGVRDSGRIELTREEIDEQVLLDIANRGTCKIAGPNIAYEDRVRDITRIEVR